jgi:hypothetical protein
MLRAYANCSDRSNVRGLSKNRVSAGVFFIPELLVGGTPSLPGIKQTQSSHTMNV